MNTIEPMGRGRAALPGLLQNTAGNPRQKITTRSRVLQGTACCMLLGVTP